MNKRKGLVAVLLAAAMLLSLAGCAGKFDASGYTKAVLDANFKNETAEYVKLTKSSKENADKIFSSNMDYIMLDFEQLGQSEEMEADIRKIFEDLLKSVKYSVGEAKEDKSGNYSVDITVEPVSNFDNLQADFTAQLESYIAKVSEDVMNGKEQPSEEAMQKEMVTIIYNIMRQSLDAGITYNEPETITVHVNKGANNVYEIPLEELKTVTNAIMAFNLE